MPLYMDRHVMAGARAKAVADAHLRDLAIERRHGVRFRTYWFDEARGTTFCLVEAPNRNAVERVHGEAHGSIPNAIIEVDSAMVEAFLGRIEDAPADPAVPPAEAGLRAIVFTDMVDSTAMANRLGDGRFMEVLRTHNAIVREALRTHGGREVKHTGDGIMASFAEVPASVLFAASLQRVLARHNGSGAGEPIRVRLGVSAGEPVEEGLDLFGVSVTLAARLCQHAAPETALVSQEVRGLCGDGPPALADRGLVELKGFAEPVRTFEVCWRDA